MMVLHLSGPNFLADNIPFADERQCAECLSLRCSFTHCNAGVLHFSLLPFPAANVRTTLQNFETLFESLRKGEWDKLARLIWATVRRIT